jgi:hypothetical protein
MSETKEYPPGDYCIVELFGHVTLVGRYTEVEQFGTKMLAIEPLFDGTLLPVAFHGGAAIYRLTPCSAKVAFEQQPTHTYQLPLAIKAIVPAALLPTPAPAREYKAPPDWIANNTRDVIELPNGDRLVAEPEEGWCYDNNDEP